MIDSMKLIKLLAKDISTISSNESQNICILTSSDGISEPYLNFIEEYICVKTYMVYKLLVDSDFLNHNDVIRDKNTLLEVLISQTISFLEENTSLFPTSLFFDNVVKKISSRVQGYMQDCCGYFSITVAFIQNLPNSLSNNIDVALLAKFIDKGNKKIMDDVECIIKFRTAEKKQTLIRLFFPKINCFLEIFIVFVLFLLIPVLLNYLIDNPNKKMYYVYAYILWALPALLTYIDKADPAVKHKSDFMENAIRVWAILFALFCVNIIVGLKIIYD
ncbi:hypothetical protein [Phascolarctobacterium faecium]|jgi:hypothetical protein|uniref:hypothetical protein n=1 Tax=Phascolarctobacterium faecium TaxID=33025 RepID=UPI003AB87D29